MRTTRRKVIGGALGIAIAIALVAGYAAALQNQPGQPGAPPSGQKSQKKVPITDQDAQKMGKVTLLFVQNADSVTFDNGTMTMKGVSPTTVFFSDRPQRIAGHMTTKEFVPFWSEGKDSFLSDPPNANLSIFDDDKVTDVVVEIRNPKLNGTELSYDVKVLEGDMPQKGGACSLFIDVIGMPLTPVSYAGAARRAYRY
jgi:hypothetical protein